MHPFGLRPTCLAVAALLATGLTAGPAHAGTPVARSGYLVTARTGGYAAMLASLRRHRVEVTRAMPGVGVAAVSARAEQLRGLGGAVAGVTRDTGVRLAADAYASGSYSAATDPNSLYTGEQTIGVRQLWARTTGRGVDVALLDSGVTPVAGLSGAGKIVQGPDLSFDSRSPSLRHLDGFGHGTHLAGIIAGRDSGASPANPGDSTGFLGVAPDARVVSVKVADAYGNADLSQVIAGIDWVVQHRADAGMNIRVLNLSLGTPSTQGYGVDPLAHAAEQAWFAGIVVVAAAGNDGRGDGQLLDPAYDPYVLAVGASDSRGTQGVLDDVIPDFSSHGDGMRNPDVVAPGVSVPSLRVPGSYLDQQYGGATAGSRFLRGSGTSQSAATVSGAVALLLQQRPGLSPDGVKDVLKRTARLLMSGLSGQGRGVVRVADAAGVSPGFGATQNFAHSTGTGSLDAARGGYDVVTPAGVALTGERDIFGRSFSAAGHATAAQARTAWTGGTWNGSAWTGTAYGADGTWLTTPWSGTDWSGQAWPAPASGTWDGRTWAGGYWSGRTWSGRTWSGRTWSSAGWQ